MTSPDGDSDGLHVEDVGDAVVMPRIVDPHVRAAWGRIASLRLGLPSAWPQARARGPSFAGLGRRKGQLAPYVGEGLFGRVLQTILRGATISSDSEPAGSGPKSAPRSRTLLGCDSA